MPIRDILLALLVVSMWGFNFVVIKVGIDHIPPLLLTGLRFLFTALPAVFFLRPPDAPRWLIAAYGFMFGVAQFGLLFTAIGLGMSPGLASLVLQLQVFVTIALALVFFHEQPLGGQFVAFVIALVGLVFIALSKMGQPSLVPFLFVVGAAFAWGTANIIAKKVGKVDMLALVVWASLVPPLPLFALSLMFEGSDAVLGALRHPTWLGVASVAFLAYPVTVFGLAIWGRLLTRYPAALVAPFALLIPVCALLSSALILGEHLDAFDIAGGIAVFAGLVLNVIASRQYWGSVHHRGGSPISQQQR